MLTDRQKDILKLIIALYAKEHAPIGSKALLSSIAASSATIRNDMKVLEDAGLIQKEHTSSGRIPSVDGYKYYVDNVLKLEQIGESELFTVMKAFDGEFYRLSDLMRTAADTLSEMTSLTSFVLNVPQRDQEMKNFDIVMLDAHSALAVYTLSTGDIRTNQFALPKSLNKKDLQVLKDIVTQRLVGKKVIEIHYSLMTEIPQIVSAYFTVARDILTLLDVIFDGLFTDSVTVSGQQRVFEYERSMAVTHYQLFTSPQLMGQAIRRLTEGDELRAVKFDNTESLRGLSLISQKFLIPYRGLGTLALVGPVELDYRQVMTALDLTAKVLTMKLTDYYRYLDSNHYEIK